MEELRENDSTNKVELEETASAQEVTKKRKILSPEEYKEIYDFIVNYNGLIIECELEMIFARFADIDRQTLRSIVQIEMTHRCRVHHWEQEAFGKKYLKTFEKESADNWSTQIIVNMAVEKRRSPVSFCRAILQEKYSSNKTQITRLLKYPGLINDAKLSANVMQCLCCDSQEGPLIDLKRRVLGEEYEFLLKEMATAAGMHFYDENDLRRLGYDKTPDIKLILPFLYKDNVVNWIESKATFGGHKIHKQYINHQLNSYINRFGPGIIIYWFGYRTDVPEMTENNIGIIVLDDFPSAEDIEILQLNANELDDDESITDNYDKLSKLDTSETSGLL